MLIRFTAFYDELREGQLPVRWLGRLNHTYGYPAADFAYPGFMYIAAPIHATGFGFVKSIKILIALTILASSVGMYLWLSRLFGPFPSAIGAILYTYAPYHLFDLYKRGSVGELLALSIVPFILWQLERKSVFWTSLLIGLFLISHNILAMLFLPVIICYMLLNLFIEKEKKPLLYRYLTVLLVGFGLSAFFWIPAIHDLQYIVFSNTKVSEWQQYFSTIAIIGYQTFLVIAIVVGYILLKKIQIRKHRLTVLLFIIGIGALFLATAISTPFWYVIPASFIQFPFRLLSVVILCIAFLGAAIVSVIQKKYQIPLGILLILCTLYPSYQLFAKIEYTDKGDMYYANNQSTTTTKDEYMPEWVKEEPLEQPKEKVTSTKGTVTLLENSSHRTTFTVTSSVPTTVTVNTIYFPGWHIYDGSKELSVSYNDPKGVIQVVLPKGTHHVVATFAETPLRLVSDMISLFSLLFLLSFVIYNRIRPVFFSYKK